MLGTKRVPHCARKNRALTGTALSEEMERAEAVGGEAAAASRFRQDADVARVDGVATPAVGWGPRLLPPMSPLVRTDRPAVHCAPLGRCHGLRVLTGFAFLGAARKGGSAADHLRQRGGLRLWAAAPVTPVRRPVSSHPWNARGGRKSRPAWAGPSPRLTSLAPGAVRVRVAGGISRAREARGTSRRPSHVTQDWA